jgi:hypothetical protein
MTLFVRLKAGGWEGGNVVKEDEDSYLVGAEMILSVRVYDSVGGS